MSIYADYAATTPVADEVTDKMMEVFRHQYGNPSSIHSAGRSARRLLDESRDTMARILNCSPREIIFTSGATESNNTAIKGSAYMKQKEGRHLITTQIEHHSVLHVFEQLEREGFEVTYLPVKKNGMVDIEVFKQALREDTILVSIMGGNNETGVIQPIDEIAEILSNHSAHFHVDGVQLIGHMPIDLDASGIDLFTLTAHKFFGPKGTGMLYVRNKTAIQYQQLGGAQETKRRAGTENTALIAGMSTALKLAHENLDERNLYMTQLKSHFIARLQENEVPFAVNGDMNNALSHIINLHLPILDVELLLTLLDMEGIYVSSGSACTAGSVEPSHVLAAMFGENPRTKESIRFSFSHLTTEQEVEQIADVLKTLNDKHNKEA